MSLLAGCKGCKGGLGNWVNCSLKVKPGSCGAAVGQEPSCPSGNGVSRLGPRAASKSLSAGAGYDFNSWLLNWTDQTAPSTALCSWVMERLEGEAALGVLRGFVGAGFGFPNPSCTIPCRTPKVVVLSFSPGLGSDVLIHLCVQGRAVAAACPEFGRWNSFLVTVSYFWTIYGQIRFVFRAPNF